MSTSSKTVVVQRDTSARMKHRVTVGNHSFDVDEPADVGGEDLGPNPHQLYDSALASCKALTVLWYARRKNIPLEDIKVTVQRDDSQERQGVYKLDVLLDLRGPELSAEQRQELLNMAGKCPVHKLMAQVTTEITTQLAEPSAS